MRQSSSKSSDDEKSKPKSKEKQTKNTQTEYDYSPNEHDRDYYHPATNYYNKKVFMQDFNNENNRGQNNVDLDYESNVHQIVYICHDRKTIEQKKILK